MKQVSNKEREQEKINIEKEAKVLYSGMPTIQFEAYLKKIREEKRLNSAENIDLQQEIYTLEDNKPVQKQQTVLNTVLPVAATAVAGSIVANILLSKGLLVGYTANDINDVIGMSFGGLAAGGFAGLVNSINYCTKPITKAIINRQIAKKERKLAENERRNAAITYLEECLYKEEQRCLNDEEDPTTQIVNPYTTCEDDGQISIFDYTNENI